MSAGWLLQIFVDISMVLGVAVLWLRLRRPPQDDPRLSRGLQLLQSKISVLEDLSDRTDAQVKQLTALIDQKARLLQNKVIEAEHQIQRVDQSMRRSKEVAEIFQDKIPHEEILERQNTIKYVKAAKMAHSGHSISEIAAEVDLPEVQIELIAKLNKDNLVFDAEALPEWAKELPVDERAEPITPERKINLENDLAQLFAPPQTEYASLKRIGEEFRNACIEFDAITVPAASPTPVQNEISQATRMMAAVDPGLTAPANISETSVLYEGAKRMTNKIVESATELLQQAGNKAQDFIDTKPLNIKKFNPPSLTTPPKKIAKETP